MAEKSADDIFKEFKEHSVTEFFRKNSQMLGYSGKVRSLTTIVHEYVTNSLDACEEAGIIPELEIRVKEIAENRYGVSVTDNGPGIPKTHVGKALASVLTGTKFHRYIQQRGQQGIGASGCTLLALITTGKGIQVRSSTGREAFSCTVSVDIKSNKPVIAEMETLKVDFKGLSVYGEFGEVKYERSDHGVYEYLLRTALANPHAGIRLIEPDGNEVLFPRSVKALPQRPKEIKPHPLGITATDLLDFARSSKSRKVSSFMEEAFSRVSHEKTKEISAASGVDFEKEPQALTLEDAEKIAAAIKQLKWIAPDLDSLSEIGEEQIYASMKSLLAPNFMAVVERKPKVFRGGIPFVVEVGIAYGGKAGRVGEKGAEGAVLRFANKVPLLFDAGSCAISEAANGIEWRRYSIRKFEEEPVSVLVSMCSVYIPYSGVGKQAIAQDDEVVEEIKLSIMEAARKLQRHLSGVRQKSAREGSLKTIMSYVPQLANDLGGITGKDSKEIESKLRSLVGKKYKVMEKAEANPSSES